MSQNAVFELARKQHGVVTRADVLATGVSGSTVDRWLKNRLLIRFHRGVYLVGGARDSAKSRWLAAVIAAGQAALLSHWSAAHLWSVLPRRRSAKSSVTIPYPGDRKRPGIRIYRSRTLTDDDHTRHRGIPVTTPARTLVDLAEFMGGRDLERVVARAERDGLVTSRKVRQVMERCASKPGVLTLEAILARAGGAAFIRSEAEARFLELVREAELANPRSNHVVGPYEVDFHWPAARVAVEIDGFAYHSSRATFENDRRRDAWLTRNGIQVLRFTWKQIVDTPIKTITTLIRAIQRPEA